MKVSKRQLRSIIREEKSKLLSEQGGWVGPDNMAMVLIEFGKAWSSLGGAIQEQVEAIAETGGYEDNAEEFEEVVYQQNPNAIDRALRALENKGENLEGMDHLMDMLWAAQDVMKQ